MLDMKHVKGMVGGHGHGHTWTYMQVGLHMGMGTYNCMV